MTMINITREDALRLGIVTCAECGHPPNNHFDFGTKPCAHCKCKKYVEQWRVFGRVVKGRRKKK